MYWIKRKKSDELQNTVSEIQQCFAAWKESLIDADGTIVTFSPLTLGMLSSYPNGIRKPADDVAPWHCVGLHVNNEIDLAFHLWLESNGEFEFILKKHGIPTIFSLCGFLASRNPNIHPDSLIRLNGFLTQRLAEFADVSTDLAVEYFGKVKQRNRQDDGLKQGRIQSAINRREKAAQRKKNIRLMAADYFRNRPSHGIEEAVRHIRRHHSISAVSIRKAIKGVKTQTLRSLHTRSPN